MISVRQSLNAVGSIKQIAHERNASFPLSLGHLVSPPPVNDFLDDQVEILPKYIQTGPEETQSQRIQAIIEALDAASAYPQTIDPSTGESVNQEVVIRQDPIERLKAFLPELKAALEPLQTKFEYVSKRNFGAAAGVWIPPVSGSNISLEDMEAAFTSPATTHSETEWLGWVGDEWITRFYDVPAYSGPVMSVQERVAALELVKGGPQRDFQLNLLEGEVQRGLRNFEGAIQSYDRAFAVSPAYSPAGQFVSTRCALARLAQGDQLFRKQRRPGEAERQNIIGIYDAAVRLLQERSVSPSDPRRQEVEAHAAKQKAKLQNGMNYLGLWEAFVPVQRYGLLKELAYKAVEKAKESVNEFRSLLEKLDQQTEEVMNVQFQADQELRSLEIVNERRSNSTLARNKILEQLTAIEDQQDALVPQTVVKGFRAIVEGASLGGPLGMANAAAGIGGTLVNFFDQRNQLAHQRRMIEIELAMAENERDIGRLESELSQRRIEFYRQKSGFVTDKRLNINLLNILVELNERRAERQLEGAIFLAYLYERALAFYLGEPNIEHIHFHYVDGPTQILDAAKSLDEHLGLVEQEMAKITEEEFDDFEEAVSLRESYPIQFRKFLQDGEMDFVYSLYQLSKRWPWTHQCRLYDVGVELIGSVPTTGFSGTLTHTGRFLVRDKIATIFDPQATRLVPTDEQLAEALRKQQRDGSAVASVGGVLYYDLEPKTTTLSQHTQHVKPFPQQFTLDLIEGFGPTGLWRLSINDHGDLSLYDVVIHFAIVGRKPDTASLQPKVEALTRSYEAELAAGDQLDRFAIFSLREHFEDTLDALEMGPAPLNLAAENFPNGLTNLKFKMVIIQALNQQGKGVPNIGLEISRADVGFREERVTKPDGYTEDLDATPQPLPPDQRFPIIGNWQIRLVNPNQFSQFKDLRLFFMYAYEEA